jgi:predicted membrane-bound spermidine synthase
VFLGLLAGREIGLALRLRHRQRPEVSSLILRDAGKAFLGSFIAIALALILPQLIKPVVANERDAAPAPAPPPAPAAPATPPAEE